MARARGKVQGFKKVYADGAIGEKCAAAIVDAHGLNVEIVYATGATTGRALGKTWSSLRGPRPSPQSSWRRPRAESSSDLMP